LPPQPSALCPYTTLFRSGRTLAFSYQITNLNSGHNLPSGSLGAQPQIWVNVALIDPDGKNIWESGYLDRNGDLADLHSLEVAAGDRKSTRLNSSHVKISY